MNDVCISIRCHDGQGLFCINTEYLPWNVKQFKGLCNLVSWNDYLNNYQSFDKLQSALIYRLNILRVEYCKTGNTRILKRIKLCEKNLEILRRYK